MARGDIPVVINDDPETVIFRDYSKLYLAAKNGEYRVFNRLGASSEDILHMLSPAQNTFLHIAAKFGKKDIVTYICKKDPSLISLKNSSGETALHLAARGGHQSIAEALVNKADDNNILRVKNKKGNTALHEALINDRKSTTAQYLIPKDPEVLYDQNKDGETALYLAAKAGFPECVAMILRFSTDQRKINKQFEKRSPCEAAVMGKHKGVLKEMWKAKPSLIELPDGKGRTPLHHAASLGYREGVVYLIDKYPPSAIQRDSSGSLPIHLASINGHVDIIEALLNVFPDAEELLNKDDQNILHLAASNGRYNVVRYILNNSREKNSHLSVLINMKDKNGDTPLHLAASKWHLRIVFDLTWHKELVVTLVNDKGLTALDLAEKCDESEHPKFRQGLTCAALKAASVPKGVPRSVTGDTESEADEKSEAVAKQNYAMGKYKERVDTFLMMSTFIATITFAAGFTLPGGYHSSSDTDLGIATMLREKGFHVFVFCDTMAMCSSIIAAVALIWAKLGDTALVYNALTLTAPLLGFALGMMSMAFTAGVFLAVSKLTWLGNAVLLMGITFTAILSVLLIPLCVPLASSNRIYRYISYYPFYLVILANSRLAK